MQNTLKNLIETCQTLKPLEIRNQKLLITSIIQIHKKIKIKKRRRSEETRT